MYLGHQSSRDTSRRLSLLEIMILVGKANPYINFPLYEMNSPSLDDSIPTIHSFASAGPPLHSRSFLLLFPSDIPIPQHGGYTKSGCHARIITCHSFVAAHRRSAHTDTWYVTPHSFYAFASFTNKFPSDSVDTVVVAVKIKPGSSLNASDVSVTGKNSEIDPPSAPRANVPPQEDSDEPVKPASAAGGDDDTDPEDPADPPEPVVSGQAAPSPNPDADSEDDTKGEPKDGPPKDDESDPPEAAPEDPESSPDDKPPASSTPPASAAPPSPAPKAPSPPGDKPKDGPSKPDTPDASATPKPPMASSEFATPSNVKVLPPGSVPAPPPPPKTPGDDEKKKGDGETDSTDPPAADAAPPKSEDGDSDDSDKGGKPSTDPEPKDEDDTDPDSSSPPPPPGSSPTPKTDGKDNGKPKDSFGGLLPVLPFPIAPKDSVR